MKADYDVVIVGGGLVGASLACALARLPIRIAVVEGVPLDSDAQPSFDDRTLALAYGSRRIFEGIAVWSQVAARGAVPIERIHVSDRGHLGITRIDRRVERVEALGYVVTSRALGAALATALSGASLELLCPARLQHLEITSEHAALTIAVGGEAKTLTARLVVGADGMDSAVRELAGIRSRHIEYGQTALVTNVSTERFHDYTAYERFTDSGPMAVLPASTAADETGGMDNRCALVWTVDSEEAEAVLGWDDELFLGSLQERFGYRLGKFRRVGRRHAYPLTLRRAREDVRARLALIGNAAHTLHPIAGQGFNLGLRDVALLAQVIADAARAGQDPGSMKLLGRYAIGRRRDHLRVIAFTDSLVRMFSNSYFPLAVLRNIGMVGAEIIPPIKHRLARQAMGLTGVLPRLGRGLSL